MVRAARDDTPRNAEETAGGGHQEALVYKSLANFGQSGPRLPSFEADASSAPDAPDALSAPVVLALSCQLPRESGVGLLVRPVPGRTAPAGPAPQVQVDGRLQVPSAGLRMRDDLGERRRSVESQRAVSRKG